MKLSQLRPEEVEVLEAPVQKSAPLKLSQINPQELEVLDYQKELPSNPAQAALEGFGQGATLGYLPQLQAGLEQLLPNPTADVDNALLEQGFTLPEDNYTTARDQNIQRQERLQESNPWAYTSGSIAGALNTSLIPVGGVAQGAQKAKTLKAILTGAGTGAAYGLAQNPGDVEGEINPLQAQERLSNAGTGALIGGAIPGGVAVAKGARDLVKSAPQFLKNIAQNAAFKSAGAMLRDFRQAHGRKAVNRIGQKLLDKKIVQAGDTFDDIAKKVKTHTDEIGSRIGEVYTKADEAVIGLAPTQINPINPVQIADDLEKQFTKELSTAIGGKKALKAITEFLDDLRSSGNSTSINDIISRRRELDDLINYTKQTKDLPLVQQKLKVIRDKLNDVAYKRLKEVDDIRGTKFSDEIKNLNSDFSDLITVKKIAEDRVSREAANRSFSLGDRISGGTGAVVGGMIGGAPGAIAVGATSATIGKLARQRGGPVLAKVAEKTASILDKDPSLLGRFSDIILKAASENPEKLVEVVAKLKASDPSFERRIENIYRNQQKTRNQNYNRLPAKK